jgi:polyisoprenoid-binding protein YceI
MKKTGIIVLMFFAGFALKAQEQIKVDSYKVAFYSKDATGVFKEMSGTVSTGFSSDSLAQISSSNVEAKGLDLIFNLTIKVASINTGNGVQNKHAKSSEWFHAEKHPTIDFISSHVYKTDKGIFADGSLTLHGVTKEVSIPISIKSTEEKNDL